MDAKYVNKNHHLDLAEKAILEALRQIDYSYSQIDGTKNLFEAEKLLKRTSKKIAKAKEEL